MDANSTRSLVAFAAELRQVADVLEPRRGVSEQFLAGLGCLHDRLRQHVEGWPGPVEPSLQAMVLRSDTPTEAHTWREAAQAIERMAVQWREEILEGRQDMRLTISEAADRCQVSDTEIRRWKKAGMPTIPPPTPRVRGETVRLSDLLWAARVHGKHQERTLTAPH
jgi:hypothetical protein